MLGEVTDLWGGTRWPATELGIDPGWGHKACAAPSLAGLPTAMDSWLSGREQALSLSSHSSHWLRLAEHRLGASVVRCPVSLVSTWPFYCLLQAELLTCTTFHGPEDLWPIFHPIFPPSPPFLTPCIHLSHCQAL